MEYIKCNASPAYLQSEMIVRVFLKNAIEYIFKLSLESVYFETVELFFLKKIYQA